MNSLVLKPIFVVEPLLEDLVEGTAILLGSEERGAGEAALAAREDFFCVTLVQSLMVRGPHSRLKPPLTVVQPTSGQGESWIRIGRRLEGAPDPYRRCLELLQL